MSNDFKSNKYFNDAIYGNDTITASLNRQGKLLRVFYPTPNFKQLIENVEYAFKINDQSIIYMHEDINSIYNQTYVNNTNIVKTEIVNKNYGLNILQTDFVPIKENFLVRKYRIRNDSLNEISLKPIITSEMITNTNNETGSLINEEALIQYNHDYALCIFSKEDINKYKVNNLENDIENGEFDRKEYTGLSNKASISYKEIVIKPNEQKTFVSYIYINDNRKKSLLNEAELEIIRIKKINVEDKEEETKKYWEKLVLKHTKHNIKNMPLKLQDVYNRTILLLELMIDKNTGGISAAMEIDEHKTKSGRYSFVWPRDVFYVLKAYDILGFEEYTEKFFDVFAKKTQSRNGRWEQRFYTDGSLAPSWGYQIDETATIIIAALNHYEHTKNIDFLIRNLQMLQKGYKYLLKYTEKILNGEKSNSFDLWETYEGESIYGVSSVFCAINSMKKIYENVIEKYKENRLKQEQIKRELIGIDEKLLSLKEYIYNTFYDENRNSYVRNVDDKKIDISALSVVTPFNIFSQSEKRIQNTVDVINMTLKTYTGGLIRFENDGYLGGYHPWSLANLWMAEYNAINNQKDLAKENLNFVIKTATKHGFIAEQINNETLSAEWVIGLSWAHGMFICLFDEMIKNDMI